MARGSSPSLLPEELGLENELLASALVGRDAAGSPDDHVLLVDAQAPSSFLTHAGGAEGIGRGHTPPNDLEREKKRRSLNSDSETSSEGTSVKIRKPTHTLRKEEKESLLKETEALEAQLDFLKERAGLSNRKLAEKELTNEVMREAVRVQQLSVAKTQSVVSEFLDAQETNPLSTFIRLGTDWSERRETLLAMKETKLRHAYEYMAARSQLIDPLRPHCSANTFETVHGDKRGSRLDLTPFEGVQSVKQVYDILLYCLMSMEISISERLGHITVREEYDSVENSISNYRLLSDVNGVPVESNGVMFSKYYERHELSNGSPCGVVMVDFVDSDELYPYTPSERIRKDITIAIIVTPHMKKTQHEGRGEAKEELVVTMARAGFVKLHHPQFDLSPAAQEMREDFSGWGQVMVKAIKEMLLLPGGLGVHTLP